MGRIIAKILIIILLVNTLPLLKLQDFKSYAGDVIDYRTVPKPKDVRKQPEAGMRIIIHHQDGSPDETLNATNNSYPQGYAKVGDTISVRDISVLSPQATDIEKWDFQYVTPSGREEARVMSGSQYGLIDTITLDEAGNYEFYLAVMDDVKSSQETFEWWQNWSWNGIQRAVKILADGNEYWCYFVSILITVEEDEEQPAEIKAIINAPDTVSKGETFSLFGGNSYTTKGEIIEYYWESK
ncbi:hypothetical protein, partial [Paramaledivibacter caminithermalis]